MKKFVLLKISAIILGIVMIVDLIYGLVIPVFLLQTSGNGFVVLFYPIIIAPLALGAGLLLVWVLHGLGASKQLKRLTLWPALAPLLSAVVFDDLNDFLCLLL